MRLPEPMLLRAGKIPSGGRWIFELKWDGFRGLVRTGPAFTVRSRRGWQMTQLLPELALIAAVSHPVNEIAHRLLPRHPAIVTHPRPGAYRFSQYESLTRNTLCAGAENTPP